MKRRELAWRGPKARLGLLVMAVAVAMSGLLVAPGAASAAGPDPWQGKPTPYMYHGYPVQVSCSGAYRKIKRTGGLDYPLASRTYDHRRTYTGANYVDVVVTARVSAFYEYDSCRGGLKWIEYWPTAYQSKRDVTSCAMVEDRCSITFFRGTWKSGLQRA